MVRMNKILFAITAILLVAMLGCGDSARQADDQKIVLPEADNNADNESTADPNYNNNDQTTSGVNGVPGSDDCTNDACRKEKAILNKDASLCVDVIGLGIRNDCYYQTGISAKNHIACSKISDLTLRKKCYTSIGYTEPKQTIDIGSTFKSTGKQVCTQGGAPIIRVYGASYCPHCRWVAKTYHEVLKEYSDSGLIKAYYWELNGGDDLMTDVVAAEMSEEEIRFYNENDPSGTIPYFNLGCAYERLGNGYEGEDQGLEKEEAELRKMIDELIVKLINQ